jgi:ATP-dependent exoDNAse (exonuclease V) alpha subunit
VDEVRAQHQRLAAEHGNQPQKVMAEASRRWGVELEPERSRRVAEGAVDYARERGMERAAVVDERVLLRDALRHTMCEARLPEIKTELEKRIARGELIEVPRREGEAGRAFTTGEMQGYERDIVRRMQAGRDGNVIVDGYTREWTFKQHPHLSLSQHRAVEDVLESRDRMMALEGVAGAGKTTSLTAIRDAVEHHGYEVKGLAPTSRAAQKLAETGMETETLQRHLTRGQQPDDGRARVYVVDEASMISTRQMYTFLERLTRHDRVLFVGDVRQHEAVEAGRPYAQMQEAGLRTARLDEILRQKDPVLKETVEQLARGEVKQAIENLNYQGRVHEFKDREERIGEIAREYARSPEKTLVISPDNASRQEINRHIHRAMHEARHVTGADHRVPVLHARQELTGADRQHAQNYTEGDVIRFSKGSKPLGIEPGEYARVARVDEESNRLTITRKSGEELSYDPRRLQGVTVYRDGERSFAEGERVQMTSPYQPLHLANRELGTIKSIDGDGNLKLKMDSGREVAFNVREMPHLDYGYAVTSHSSQGQTADRVLVHVDSAETRGELLNSRMAYVSVSRAEFDVQMYTNDAKTLGHVLSRDVSHPSATQQQMAINDELAGQKIMPQSVDLDISPGYGLGLGH